MEHYKISREILNLGRKIVIKMNVVLLGENNRPCISQYVKPNTVSIKGITLSPKSFITMEYKDGGQWSPDKSILVNEINLSKVIKGFRNIHKSVYDGEVFAQSKSGKVIMYQDKARELTEHIRVGSQNILLKPWIIEDDTGVTYEGIIMYLNNLDNFVELPIDMLDGIVYTLEKIDMFLYSQSLLNCYMEFINNESKFTDIKVNTIPLKEKEKFNDKSTLIKDEDIFNGLEGI